MYYNFNAWICLFDHMLEARTHYIYWCRYGCVFYLLQPRFKGVHLPFVSIGHICFIFTIAFVTESSDSAREKNGIVTKMSPVLFTKPILDIAVIVDQEIPLVSMFRRHPTEQ